MKKLILWTTLLLLLGSFTAWTVWDNAAAAVYDDAVDQFAAAGLPLSTRELVPAPVPEEENGAPDYLRAMELAKQLPRVDFSALPRISAEVQRVIERDGGALDLMLKAAERPHCVYPHTYYDDPFTGETVDRSGLGPLVRLMAARALLRSEDGDQDGAIRDLRAVFRLARSLGSEANLLSQILRLTCASAGISALETILSRCASAIDSLEQCELERVQGAVLQGLRGEAAFSSECFAPDDLRFEREILGDLSFFYPLVRPYFHTEQSLHLNYLRKFSQALKQPYWVAIPATDQLEREYVERGGMITNCLAVSTARHVRREAKITARIELLYLAAECLDFRRKNGRYPEEISKLALDADVTDPLSGQPFRLVRKKQKLTIANESDEFPVSLALPR